MGREQRGRTLRSLVARTSVGVRAASDGGCQLQVRVAGAVEGTKPKGWQSEGCEVEQ
jgi:hypothetical protein